ncbi:MAG: serine hydrolase domain-containing protein [Vicinamibacterales bacterium]
MKSTRYFPLLILAFAIAFCPGVALPAGVARQEGREAAVDKVFSRWNDKTPGCAVAVSEHGEVVLEKAYGMADLEHDAKNLAGTIFEAGSVSKQFTAAAILLLARDGKLSIDDPVRNYVPELPDYGVPLTIRHMLTHTSGLRDWGSVAGLSGWPRTSRAYTHAHVLDIVSRQRSLNFTPGTSWSYSNTGYNLAAIIIDRVSGKPFAEFCRERIFEPLGMKSTSWRDDHTRIVKGRAIAYREGKDGFHINMPFENVHGNGGLLTTVGDLLRWNENFFSPRVGDAAFVKQQQQPGTYSDGTPHDYAFGLFVRPYKGVPEVGHSGSTAGYQAYLARYPEQHLSVAVLCNVSSAAAGRYAHEVSDIYLGEAVRAEPQVKPFDMPPELLRAKAGVYALDSTGEPLVLIFEKEALRAGRADAPPLVPVSPTRFLVPGRGTIDFDDDGRARLTASNGVVETCTRVVETKPTAEELAEYAGTYFSDEAETALQVVVQEGELRVLRRPNTAFVLRPVYRDGFDAQFGIVRFRRSGGRVTEMSVGLDRVWDMRFRRVGTPSS